MACKEYRTILPRYADGELPPDQGRLLRDHLPGCDSCRRTVRLLKLEDRAIRSALLGGGRLAGGGRSRSRLVRVGLTAGLLLAIFLVVLYGTYTGLADRAETAARPGEILDRPVLVRQDGVPLPLLLAEVSRRAGVEVRLSEAAARRLEPPPVVHIVLTRPVRLASLLDLLGSFYGTRARVDDGTVVLD